jgi:hypothetical protein
MHFYHADFNLSGPAADTVRRVSANTIVQQGGGLVVAAAVPPGATRRKRPPIFIALLIREC